MWKPERAHGRAESILVVEDEIVVSLDIQQKLRRLGYTIADFAISGREAVEMAEACRPNLVLMDVKLKGGMDGVDAARMISERMDIPVVFLTAFGDEETLERAKQANPFGYVLKPIEDNDLRTVVEVALYRFRMDRALVVANENLRLAQEDLQRQALRATAIGELGLAALDRSDFKSLVRSALGDVMRLQSTDTVVLFRSREDGRFVVEAGIGDPAEAASGIEVGRDWASLLEEAIESASPIHLAGSEAREGIGFPDPNGTTYRDGFMVRIDGYPRAWGVLMAVSRTEGTFDESGEHFLQSLANVLSLAMRSGQVEDAMLELSAPVMPLARGLLLVPLVGSFGPSRVQQLAEVLLGRVRDERARAVVVDVTGLGSIDAQSAISLVQVVQAVGLLGATVIMSGASALVARMLVTLGVPLDRLLTVADLQSAIEEGTRLVKRVGDAPWRAS